MRRINPIIAVIHELVRPYVSGSGVAFEELCSRRTTAEPTKFCAGLLRLDFLVGYRSKILANPKAARVSCVLSGW